MPRLLGHALALAFVLLPPGAAAATQSLPRWLPDGSPYRDVDLSAYDLPDAFTPRPAWRAVPPVPPVRRLVWKGWLAASKHRADAARLHFGRALRISPNDRHLLWAYGWAQLNLGQPADALAEFARQLALRPGQRPRWLPMAALHRCWRARPGPALAGGGATQRSRPLGVGRPGPAQHAGLDACRAGPAAPVAAVAAAHPAGCQRTASARALRRFSPCAAAGAVPAGCAG